MSDDSERAELARRIYGHSHLIGKLTLRSGTVSNEDLDEYLFESDPLLVREIVEAPTTWRLLRALLDRG